MGIQIWLSLRDRFNILKHQASSETMGSAQSIPMATPVANPSDIGLTTVAFFREDSEIPQPIQRKHRDLTVYLPWYEDLEASKQGREVNQMKTTLLEWAKHHSDVYDTVLKIFHVTDCYRTFVMDLVNITNWCNKQKFYAMFQLKVGRVPDAMHDYIRLVTPDTFLHNSVADGLYRHSGWYYFQMMALHWLKSILDTTTDEETKQVVSTLLQYINITFSSVQQCYSYYFTQLYGDYTKHIQKSKSEPSSPSQVEAYLHQNVRATYYTS